MTFDVNQLTQAVEDFGHVARVVVAKTEGSAPREAGASMLVWSNGQSGTIGGGALEWQAVERARTMAVGQSLVEVIPLGPRLGQCCGGSVTLVMEVFDASTLPCGDVAARKVAAIAGDRPNVTNNPTLKNGWIVERVARPGREIWLYGAGHVGRALMSVLAPLPDIKLVWVDTGMERFPKETPSNVTTFVAVDPAAAVKHAPPEAEHLILTYSHEFDLQICHAVLSRQFRSAGLIGSATKWARFKRRLATLGHPPAQVARISCPIGDPSLGKHPQEIAIGVAMAMLDKVDCRGATGTR